MVSLPKSESLTRILLLLIPAVAWTAFPFFTDFSTPKMVVAGFLGAAILWHLPAAFLPRLEVGLLVAMIIASLPAFMRSPDSDLARQSAVLELLSLAVCWGAAYTGAELRERLPAWLLGAGLGVLGFRLVEWLWPVSVSLLGALAGSSTLGNPDLTAELLAILMPLAVWRLWRPGWAGRCGAALLVVGTLPVLVTHESLTAWGILLVGMTAFGIACLRSRPLVRRAVIAVAILVATGAAHLVHEQAGFRGRLFLYRTAGVVALEAPVLGHGEGGFGYAFMAAQGRALQDNRQDRASWTNARHAHNFLLHMWVERGLIPALLLLSLFIAGLWRARSGPPWHIPLLLGLVVSFSGSVSYGQAVFRLLALMLLGMANPGGDRTAPERAVAWRGVAAVLAVVVVLVPIWHSIGDFQFGRGELADAHEIVPGNSRIRFALGQQRLLEGNVEEARELLHSSLPGHPNLSTPLTLGNLETRSGDFAAAEKYYLDVLAWKPDFAVAYANLAWLYHQWGKESLSDRHLVRALSLRPSDPAILRIQRQIVSERRAAPVGDPAG